MILLYQSRHVMLQMKVFTYSWFRQKGIYYKRTKEPILNAKKNKNNAQPHQLF